MFCYVFIHETLYAYSTEYTLFSGIHLVSTKIDFILSINECFIKILKVEIT